MDFEKLISFLTDPYNAITIIIFMIGCGYAMIRGKIKILLYNLITIAEFYYSDKGEGHNKKEMVISEFYKNAKILHFFMSKKQLEETIDKYVKKINDRLKN